MSTRRSVVAADRKPTRPLSSPGTTEALATTSPAAKFRREVRGVGRVAPGKTDRKPAALGPTATTFSEYATAFEGTVLQGAGALFMSNVTVTPTCSLVPGAYAAG